jgi:hypothetical protein
LFLWYISRVNVVHGNFAIIVSMQDLLKVLLASC